jgi:hypothetical protein
MGLKMNHSTEQVGSLYQDVKYHLAFILSFARRSRFAGARVVRFSDDMEDNAKWLITRTLDAIDGKYEVELNIDLFSEKQLGELLSYAKDALAQCVQLPSERLANMSGQEVHNVLSSGC